MKAVERRWKWVGNHHEKCIKALESSCAGTVPRYCIYFWTAFPYIIHTNRPIQAIKLTPRSAAQMSNSLGSRWAEKATLAAPSCNRRARWGRSSTLLHAELLERTETKRAGCNATSDWSKLCSVQWERGSDWSAVKQADLCMAFHWYSLQLVETDSPHGVRGRRRRRRRAMKVTTAWCRTRVFSKKAREVFYCFKESGTTKDF